MLGVGREDAMRALFCGNVDPPLPLSVVAQVILTTGPHTYLVDLQSMEQRPHPMPFQCKTIPQVRDWTEAIDRHG